MLIEDLIYIIFFMLELLVFQQRVGTPMDTDCAPLLADLFLYSYETDFIKKLLMKNKKRS
jgi:hypothetical protein